MIELVIDRRKLLESLDNDPQLLKELIGIFLADYPETLADLRTAVTARNSKQIAGSSHALRGSVGIFGANTAFEAACALESMGRQGKAEALDEAFSVLEREMALVTSALDHIAKDTL